MSSFFDDCILFNSSKHKCVNRLSAILTDGNLLADSLQINANKSKNDSLVLFVRSTLIRIEKPWLKPSGDNETALMIGYTNNQFTKDIENKFKDGMTWKNRSKWHIDHVIPVKQFLSNDITDIKIINALDNLEPLWAKDNLSKSGRVVSNEAFMDYIRSH